jgi:hypothetical protein
LSVWVAVDVLRANAVPIDPSILRKAFPTSEAKPPQGPPSEQIKAIYPEAGKHVTLLAVIRDLFKTTKRTERLKSLGTLGAKFLQLPKGPFWQATLVVNGERPNLTYTCILPEQLGLRRDVKDKMVLAKLEARVIGSHAVWLATDVQLVSANRGSCWVTRCGANVPRTNRPARVASVSHGIAGNGRNPLTCFRFALRSVATRTEKDKPR